MAIKNFSVKLEGEGQIHSPKVILENVPINLKSNNGGLIWENPQIILNTDAFLNINMECFAVSGTKWKLLITDLDSNKNVFEQGGTTGSEKPNISILSEIKPLS